MTESIRSALTEFLGHFEIAMWSEGVDPVAAMRVINKLMFGDPEGSPQMIVYLDVLAPHQVAQIAVALESVMPADQAAEVAKIAAAEWEQRCSDAEDVAADH